MFEKISKWEKRGLIITPQKNLWWMQTHAMIPTLDHLEGSLFRVYFSGRDKENRSHIGYAVIDIGTPVKVLEYCREPVLTLGELGCFDDNGVTPSWVLDNDGKKFLYYIGWRPRSTTRMSLIAGLAVSTDGGETFSRVSRASILRQTDMEPFLILTAPCVMIDNGTWKMWYVSGTKWLSPDLPRYNVKYAESEDGISWNQQAVVCIDAESEKETALARPCVLKENEIYRMWYSTKAVETSYRIGYAESRDGVAWQRMDSRAGIDVSKSGWDSEMIEYAFVINHKGKKYMFYNGNGYGTTGIGLAVLEE